MSIQHFFNDTENCISCTQCALACPVDCIYITSKRRPKDEEIKKTIDFTLFILRSFGFEDFKIDISTRPEKAVGDEADWEMATNALKAAIDAQGLEHGIDEGGGAFYGPKIDIKVFDALKRPH